LIYTAGCRDDNRTFLLSLPVILASMMLLEWDGRRLTADGLIGIYPLRQTITKQNDRMITKMRFITKTAMFFAKH
jgi:hypothetical protein